MNKRILLISILLSLSLVQQMWGQILDSENRLGVVLSDGTQVVLYGKATSLSDEKTKDYYYLPTNPRLSFRPDGTPEFLFTKFTTENREADGGISGAIMHFLLEWGLTPEQESELKSILSNRHSGAKLLGSVDVLPGEGDSFRIISATVNESEGGLTEALVTSGKAPVLPGQKVAVASRLDQHGAQLLASTFEEARSVTDLSVELAFDYTLRYPAAQGRATIHWDRFHQQFQKDSANYTKEETEGHPRGGFWGTIADALVGKPTDEHFTYEEMREFYDSLQEQQIVEVQFDEGQESERVSKVREAFFEYFLNQLSEEVPGQRLSRPTKSEQESMPDIKHGKSYKFNASNLQTVVQSGKKEFNLTYRLAIKKTMAITGNLASWYDGVRDNPRCVTSVNLNDPFFQHRDINFILDLDAKEMFEREVNYVTVNVRKKRSAGHDFSDRVTIDQKYLETNGVMASVTYARGEDRNPDQYEYAAQWSLRGGHLFPEQPSWQNGEWEGVTLAPPVRPRTIEVEADLEELKANGITRVTAQIRYPQYTVEQEANIHVSPAKGEPILSEQIFLDPAAKGYAYRLIFNHKEEGKLATNWQVQLNDDYIYAVVPEPWKKEETQKIDFTSPVVEDAKETGSKLLQQAGQTILDKFSSIIGINPNN